MNELEEIFEWVKTDTETRLLSGLFSGDLEDTFNLLYKKGDSNEKTNGCEVGRERLFSDITTKKFGSGQKRLYPTNSNTGV